MCSTRWKILLNKEFCSSNHFSVACCLSVSTSTDSFFKPLLKYATCYYSPFLHLISYFLSLLLLPYPAGVWTLVPRPHSSSYFSAFWVWMSGYVPVLSLSFLPHCPWTPPSPWLSRHRLAPLSAASCGWSRGDPHCPTLLLTYNVNAPHCWGASSVAVISFAGLRPFIANLFLTQKTAQQVNWNMRETKNKYYYIGKYNWFLAKICFQETSHGLFRNRMSLWSEGGGQILLCFVHCIINAQWYFTTSTFNFLRHGERCALFQEWRLLIIFLHLKICFHILQ